LNMHSHLSALVGNLVEAVKLGEQAVALDPLDTIPRLQLGYRLYVASRYDEAQVELQKALELNPQAAFVHFVLCKVLIAEAKPLQALAEIEKEPSEWGKLTGQVLAYHALGRGQDSNAALAELIAKHDTDSAYQIAEVYAFRGESAKSLGWLQRAYNQRDAGLPEIKTDPLLKNLRHDSRYTELLQKMHMPT
jgi:tetratricopeptide (TPR) repeat protein